MMGGPQGDPRMMGGPQVGQAPSDLKTRLRSASMDAANRAEAPITQERR